MNDVQTKETKQSEETLFAVYGTLKAGYGNHHYLREAEYLGTHTTEPEYTMYQNGFPIVVEGGDTAIKCEIYKTGDPTVIANVNNLEGFSGVKKSPNNWYDRKTIQTKYGPAEMYVMYKQMDRTVITSGEWGRRNDSQ